MTPITLDHFPANVQTRARREAAHLQEMDITCNSGHGGPMVERALLILDGDIAALQASGVIPSEEACREAGEVMSRHAETNEMESNGRALAAGVPTAILGWLWRDDCRTSWCAPADRLCAAAAHIDRATNDAERAAAQRRLCAIVQELGGTLSIPEASTILAVLTERHAWPLAISAAREIEELAAARWIRAQLEERERCSRDTTITR